MKDIPFINSELHVVHAFAVLQPDDIHCDESSFDSDYEWDSLHLKDLIINSYGLTELTDVSRDITSLVIEGRNDLEGRLRIADYQNLESIEISDQSLANISHLIITNNPSLKSISCGGNSCQYVFKLEISSKPYILFFSLIFLN